MVFRKMLSNNFVVINESVEIKSRIYDNRKSMSLTEAIFLVRSQK